MYKLNQIALTVLILLISFTSNAQEINFGTFSSSYSMTVTPTNGTTLNFGQLISGDVDPVTIALDDFETIIISITGVKYLDVFVQITAPDYIIKDDQPGCVTDNCRVPFTLSAAYANKGMENSNQAVIMNVLSNSATALFPIRSRGNAPPGPPPTPVYEGYNPALYEDTAYIYVYGSLAAGTYDAGTYTSLTDISVMVSYD